MKLFPTGLKLIARCTCGKTTVLCLAGDEGPYLPADDTWQWSPAQGWHCGAPDHRQRTW